MIHRVWTLTAVACAILSLFAGTASAQLTVGERKCIDGYNNKVRVLAKAKGLDDRLCVQRAGTGKELAPGTCVSSGGTKTSKASGKLSALYAKLCAGGEPIQQGTATGGAAAFDGATNLTLDLFGPTLGSTLTPGVPAAKCQDKAILRAQQTLAHSLNVFRKCKADGMKAGLVTDSATLEAACMTPDISDPLGKLAVKRAKLIADVDASCLGTPIATLFPGVCGSAATSTDLASCIDARVQCRACEMLNAADGMSRNCDLFDDGLANLSCGTVSQVCLLDTSPSSDSEMRIHLGALPMPVSFSLGGALELTFGASTASCAVQALNPVHLPGYGFYCFAPGAPCPTGELGCNGGPPLGVEVQSDGLAGSCTSNADCSAIADTACGGAANVLEARCVGYCSGGAGGVCTDNSDCLPSDGFCSGPEPVAPAQRDKCRISCLDAAAHGASDPGDFRCNLGVHITFEIAGAGTACDGDGVIADLGNYCVPISTQRASGSITDANFIAGSSVPNTLGLNDQAGVSASCASLAGGPITGLTMNGVATLFDDAVGLGNHSLGFTLKCQ